MADLLEGKPNTGGGADLLTVKKFVPPPEAPPGMSIDDEIDTWANRREKVEHKATPTIARLPFTELWGSGAPITSKLSLMAVLATDNPDARQEIVLKHLPGAKGSQDKYGNPMIEYKGKQYYMSRPGELDATDVAKAGGALAVTAPSLLAAPVSVPGAMVLGGALGFGQSLLGDVATQAAGGTSQQVDPNKASVSGIIGMLVPGGAALSGAAARQVYSRLAGELFDQAGGLTQRGVRILQERAGLTADEITSMTPAIRDHITQVVGHNFGSPRSAAIAYRQGLEREFNIGQTAGQLTRDPAQVTKEKNLAGGSFGGPAQQTMRTGQQAQDAQLTAAQEALRRQAGGGQTFDPATATAVLTGEQKAAQATAEAGKEQLYGAAKNPALLASSGIPPVPVQQVATVGQTVRQALSQSGPGRNAIDFPHNVPVTAQALADVEAFAAGTAGPRGVGVTELSWEQINNMRVMLTSRRSAAVQSGNKMDVEAMDDIIRGFDQHFSQNPIIPMANRANTAMKNTFEPQARTQTPVTQQVLGLMNKDVSAIQGGEVIDVLMNNVKSGKAVGALEHLQQVHPRGSPGHQVLEEQSLMRLFVDKSGDTLTPQKIVTRIDDALGTTEGPFYRQLLTQDQIHELMRIRSHMNNIAEVAALNNPSGSGHTGASQARAATQKAAGAAVGAMTAGGGSGVMDNIRRVIAAGAGAWVNRALGDGMAQNAAVRAVNPPASIANMPIGPSAYRASKPLAVAAETANQEAKPSPGAPGPLDRIWQGLLGQGGP